jgi:hypothetical protein
MRFPRRRPVKQSYRGWSFGERCTGSNGLRLGHLGVDIKGYNTVIRACELRNAIQQIQIIVWILWKLTLLGMKHKGSKKLKCNFRCCNHLFKIDKRLRCRSYSKTITKSVNTEQSNQLPLILQLHHEV